MSCNILKNRGIESIESSMICQSSGRSAAKKSIKSMLFIGLTFKSFSDRIRVLLTTKTEDYNYDII
jgi:hypothetical protein